MASLRSARPSLLRPLLNPTAAASRSLTTAAESTATSTEPSSTSVKPIDIYHVPRQPLHLTTGIVLSRPPLITRDIPAFEEAFYVYQRRLDQRLALPFTSAFYFKKKTVAEEEYKAKKKIREAKPWFYNPYDRRNGFKDEVTVGQMDKNGVWWGAGAKELGYQELVETTPSGEEKIMEESASALGIAAGKTAPERPYPRETEADRTGDLTKLDRKLSRTLYLLVKGENEGIAGGRDGWRFPMARLQGDESLRQAAERILPEACGTNMNTWFVGNVPIGEHQYNYPSPVAPDPKLPHEKEEPVPVIGRQIFFMKARILAGQVDLTGNKHGFKDFAWATKEEVKRIVGKEYYISNMNMLATR